MDVGSMYSIIHTRSSDQIYNIYIHIEVRTRVYVSCRTRSDVFGYIPSGYLCRLFIYYGLGDYKLGDFTVSTTNWEPGLVYKS